MQNLEQIRAGNALQPASQLDRSAVNKLPAMILSNGLLAAGAFCNAEGGGANRPGMKSALEATARHLVHRGLLDDRNGTVSGMIEDLSGRNSVHLQRATAEALAFLAYLKRFAPKRDN